MPTNNSWNSQDPAQVAKGGTGVATIPIHTIPIGNATSAINTIGPLTNGQLIIGSTGVDPVAASILTTDGSITAATGAGTLTLSGTQSTTAQKGSVTLATSAEALIATDSSKVITPATLNAVLSPINDTGFYSWAAAGPYFDDTTLGTFQLLVGGTGYIHSKQITWVAQNIVGMTAGNTYFIYIDSTGTIGKASTRTDALYVDNIVLFECLRDSTPAPNIQTTVKDNHPYSFPTSASNYLHAVVGTVIGNVQGGANITLNGTQKIQINGADELDDHGLITTIPDSAGVGVTWIKKYTTVTGKWARQNATDTFTGFYNLAGTPTALGANKFGVYTLYVSKDTLNVTTPTYIAVLDTAQYNNSGAATTAISNGTTAKASNELASLELCQLGYIVYSQAANAITTVIISKTTLRSTTSTSGTNQASLVNTSVTNFNGWLSSADTNVQSALDELDDSCRFTEVTAAAANLAVNRSVIANRATLVTLTLPTVAKVGDEINIVGKGAGKWLIAQNANQSIHFISITTTIGVGGSLAATLLYDSVRLVCTVANLEFTVISSCGNLTIV